MERIEKTEVKVVFKSDDGRAFPTEEECLQHEARYKKWWDKNSLYRATVYDEECNTRPAFYVDNDGEELQKLLYRTANYYRGAPRGTGWFYLTSYHDGELQPIWYLEELLTDTLKNAQQGLEIIKNLEDLLPNNTKS